MTEMTEDRGRNRRRLRGWTVGLVAAGALGAGAIALTGPAWADPSTSPSAASSGTSQSPPSTNHPASGGQRNDETLLTGADADGARAAALSAVPGGTVDRVETDADGAVYEAHMTK